MAEGNRYLAPKVKAGDLSKRTMNDGLFRNPPTYTNFGGFDAASKLDNANNGMSLERGGPTAVKGRPI
jgi:hypothetical protein